MGAFILGNLLDDKRKKGNVMEGEMIITDDEFREKKSSLATECRKKIIDLISEE